MSADIHRISIPRLGLTMKLSVGLVLVLLGALNILGFRRSAKEYVHQSNHSGTPHEPAPHQFQLNPGDVLPSQHTHWLSLTVVDRLWGALTTCQICRPLLVGIVQ
jgi:hypothetical protein